MTDAPKKILIIRFKAIGDALLGLPICGSLRKTYPDAQIDYLLYQHITPLFTNHPDIDNLITITPEERKKKLLYIKKILWLRKQKYDLVIDLINVPISAIMTYVTGAKYTLGFDKQRKRKHLYKTAIFHKETGDTISKKLEILKGLPHPATEQREWQIHIEDNERQQIKSKLSEHGVDFKRPVFFIAATSGTAKKSWPMEYMAEMLNYLRETYNAQLILNCVPGPELDFVNELIDSLDDKQDIFPDIQLSLRELAIAISVCDFFFGNDGGPSHMATGTSVPSLMVYSPIHEKENWLPLNNPRHQGVDLKDGMGITEEKRRSIRKEINTDVPKYYKTITPQIVINKLDKMIAEFVNLDKSIS